MAALPDILTVERFRQLPDDRAYLYELFHGEVVAVPRAKVGHIRRQARLAKLLEPRLPGFHIIVELPYRPVAEFELWAADVGAIIPCAMGYPRS